MDKKKTLLGFVVTMFVLAVVAGAIPQDPMVVSGKVINATRLYGFEVKVTNLNTGDYMIKTTRASGEFFFEWGMNYGYGDGFKIEVLDCDSCDSATMLFNGRNLEVSDLNLRGAESPAPILPCPECPADTTPYAECDSCCPADTTPYDADTCLTDVCPEPEPCPEPDANRAVEILLGVLGGAAVAGSAVTLTLGKVAQHYHRGIKNKHSIFTRHRDADIRHPIGEVAPVYRKNTSGKYVYIPKEER